MSAANFKKSEFDRSWQQIPEAAQPAEEIPEKGQKEAGGLEVYRDSVGYVLYLLRDGKWVTGEQFRESFHLASSSFQLSEEEGEILITVKGVGHGLGMSQFGASEMASQGQDYIEILDYFFENVTFTKFE